MPYDGKKTDAVQSSERGVSRTLASSVFVSVVTYQGGSHYDQVVADDRPHRDSGKPRRATMPYVLKWTPLRAEQSAINDLRYDSRFRPTPWPAPGDLSIDAEARGAITPHQGVNSCR